MSATERTSNPGRRRLVREVMTQLGVERLVLGIFDRSFPVDGDEDTGAGAPASRGGLRFLEFAHALGFDGIQLGPQGITSLGNPSPYDGTTFSRGTVAVSLASLASQAWGALLSREQIEEIVVSRPHARAGHIDYRYAHAAHSEAIRKAYVELCRRLSASSGVAPRDSRARELEGRFRAFVCEQAHWLESDALYEVLQRQHGETPWWDWPDPLDRAIGSPRSDERTKVQSRSAALRALHAEALDVHRFGQFVAHEQHRLFRSAARRIGIRLYGDLPIGLSARDVWAHRDLVWDAYRMGAPPSRTNPEGQPWGYAVLDPRRPDDLRSFVSMRFEKLFAEYDAVRIDHPHGHVCPWVYRSDDPDPGRAVRAGARLYDSPNLPDHPALAAMAIARAEQLNPDPSTPRHADDWVVDLDDEQVTRYGATIQAILDVARRHGAGREDIVCEVLSTLPYPLARVLDRHGLGRFRVTQKADVREPADVYRSENAGPRDWIMVGNHDTAPIWRLVDDWSDAHRRDRAAYLAARLAPSNERRDRLQRRLAEHPGLLVHAQFADLFVGPARYAMIFFTDAFGIREPYNRPGVTSEENWILRLEPRDVDEYPVRARALEALHLPLALALALRARGHTAEHRALLESLIPDVPEPARGLVV